MGAVNMMKNGFLIFLMMELVMQTPLQDRRLTRCARNSCFHRNFLPSRGLQLRLSAYNLRRPSYMIRQTPMKIPVQITPPTSKVTTSRGAETTQGISVRYSSLIVTVSQNISSSGKAPTSIPSHVGISGLHNSSVFYNSTQGPATTISFGRSCVKSGNGFNTTQITPSEKTSNVRIASNDNSANHSGQEGEQNLNNTQQPDEAGIQQIKEFFKSKGCIPASFDEEAEEFIFKNPANTQGSMKHDQALKTIETTLMSISITAEVISFAFLSFIRVPKSVRIFVHKNLLVSLALGQLVYVLDVNSFPTRNVHHTICSAISVIQHYLHASLYTWMLVEGINLYAKIVKVFTFGKSYVTYALIGWGIPGVIVGLLAAIQPSTYDMSTVLYKNFTCGTLKLTGTVDRERCWLSGNDWKFKGPVLAMLLANLGVFIIVLRVSFGKIGSTNYLQTTRKGLKAIFALLPLLGVTFLLGFFVEFHVAVEYAYVLLNSIQGVLLFFFHCLHDDEVRDAMNKMLREKKHNLQQFKHEPKKATEEAFKKPTGQCNVYGVD